MPIRLRCTRCGYEKIVPCPDEVFGGREIPEFCGKCGSPLQRFDECGNIVKPKWKPRGGPGGILE